MKHFDWNQEKNEELEKERSISFDEIVFWMMHDGLLVETQWLGELTGKIIADGVIDRMNWILRPIYCILTYHLSRLIGGFFDVQETNL